MTISTLKRRATLGLGPAALLAAQASWRLPLAHARGEGGTFVFGRGGDSVRLDPAVITDGESARVTEQIFDTLVMFDGSSTDLKPALARSWDIGPDGLSYTFHLRQGVRFHDGTPFDAFAVKWNFDRWHDAENPFHRDAVASGVTFEYYEDVTGLKDVVSSVEVVDDFTVRVSLTEPQGPFLLNLALFAFGIISPYSLGTGADYLARNPVGTGPFKFNGWIPGDQILLERFESYWGEPANLDRVVVRVIPDNAARFLALRSNAIDMMENANPEDVAAARRDRALSVILRPPMNIAYINMNLKEKPFDNVKVRQAVAMSINRSAIVEALYGGTGTVATQLIPSSLLGWNTELKGPQYDPTRAKALLAEAGYPNGFTTDFWYMPVARPYYPSPQAIAEAFASDLGKIGIKANLKTEDWGTYLQDRNALKFPIWMLGWTGDNGDTDNFLFTFFGNLRQDNSWDNPQVRALLKQAQVSADTAEREFLYKQINQIIEQELPRIPIAHNSVPLIARSYVKGYLPHPTATEYYGNVWLDK
ncbi:MAG TPA: ABC transporter substrate-binding protein [Chloroflexota bacterium]|nr:ABC transporter substrate-binding protein [Chloroflexota bacterium]